MIITSADLTANPTAGEDLRLPVLYWENLVETTNVTANSETDGYPATNLANPSTNLIWRSLIEPSSPFADHYLTVTTGSEFDYLAVANHNFSTLGAYVSVEILLGGSPGWDELTTPQIPTDDGPLIFRFRPKNAINASVVTTQVRLRISGDFVTEPEAAVLFVGKSLVFERGVQARYTPLPFGREVNVVTGRAESGDFLGRIVTGSKTTSTAIFRGLAQEWVRASLDPFLEVAARQPFFFAWFPSDFPEETGFAWLDNDPQPSFDEPGYVEIQFQMTGIVE